MKKIEVVKSILNMNELPKNNSGESFAPSNIALGKYWGKRDTELNLPVTSSLSISLKNKGAHVNLKIINSLTDVIILNKKLIANDSEFSVRLINFLNLFREKHKIFFEVDIESNLPIAAGLASSAAGFASMVLALNNLYGWQLSKNKLSILARLGSGSACRSIWNGFVFWEKGKALDGMDSHGIPLDVAWPELCIGLNIMFTQKKLLSSRDAMQRTVNSSEFYKQWPLKMDADLQLLKSAIMQKDFELLGKTAESNSLAMHATMLNSWPPICYSLPETNASMHKVWQLRADGLPIYFTQDAGPNLKFLFLKKDLKNVLEEFPSLEVV